MTREEAISWLVSLTEHEGEDIPIYDDDVEALNMAIEALAHPEKNVVAVVPCGDAISRVDAIQTIQKYGVGCLNADDFSPEQCKRFVINKLNELPSVTPQNRKGHWICHREHCENLGVIPSGLGAYEWCSNCDCGIDVREWHRNHYNFCPNCGADMRTSEEK